MELDDENAKLKKRLAEAMLDNAMLKDLSTERPTVAQLCRTPWCDVAACARTMRTCASGCGSRPASAANRLSASLDPAWSRGLNVQDGRIKSKRRLLLGVTAVGRYPRNKPNLTGHRHGRRQRKCHIRSTPEHRDNPRLWTHFEPSMIMGSNRRTTVASTATMAGKMTVTTP
jgi:hypothetical protein